MTSRKIIHWMGQLFCIINRDQRNTSNWCRAIIIMTHQLESDPTLVKITNDPKADSIELANQLALIIKNSVSG